MTINMDFKKLEVIETKTKKLEYFKKLARDWHPLENQNHISQSQNSVYAEAKVHDNRYDIPYLASSERLIGYKYRMWHQRGEDSLWENSNIFFNANGECVHCDQLIICKKKDAGITVRLKF